MKMKQKTNVLNKLCCYCGTREATTKDHIPPKSVFNKPRPHDVITVPCCLECNNEASIADERFKAYLGMHVAHKGGEAERLFKEGTLRTTRHNSKLRNVIFDSMESVYIATETGIITGKGVSVLWDNDAHDAIIERMVRGLFFHHFNKIVADSASIETYWFSKPMSDLNESLYIKSIAGGDFVYQYNKVEDSEFDSLWLFNFYNAHFAGGFIMGS